MKFAQDREIVVRGAREHNLRSVDLTIPRGAMVCFTGVSGSGKSSLAFDTLYAEGQRRYLESLSTYARQFVGQLPKPDVDYLSGLSPSISISQKSTGSNPRSTVGTITEINDFLRVLYARVGTAFCPKCDIQITAQTSDQIVSRILTLDPTPSYAILAPLIRKQKGEHRDLFEDLRKQGFARARVDGTIITLDDPPSLERLIKHDIELVVDRVQLDRCGRQRLAEAVGVAIRLGQGTLLVTPLGLEGEAAPPPAAGRKKKNDRSDKDIVFSTHYACGKCGESFEPPSPQLLSFNSPQGRCSGCDGLGEKYTFDPDLLIDSSKSIRSGAIALLGKWNDMSRWQRRQLQGVSEMVEEANGLDIGYLLKTPWKSLDKKYQNIWLNGTGDSKIYYKWRGRKKLTNFDGVFDGFIGQFLSQWNKFKNPMQKKQYEKYMKTIFCTECNGERLNSQARSIRLRSTSTKFKSHPWRSLPELAREPLDACLEFFQGLELNDVQRQIATEALKEILARLGFLLDVGLSYLCLARIAPSLSGGESQRIRLASQIGSGLAGVLYVLDEPSIGLHPRDNLKLLHSLQKLRDLGNTLIVVEHDEETMIESDMVVDFGPGPGVRGGTIVAAGPLREVVKNKDSLTASYLIGTTKVPTPDSRRSGNGKQLTIRGATQNNLKNVDVSLPLGCLICITGVSGSGKSSLITDILTPALRNKLNGAEDTPGTHKGIEGIEHLDKIIDIDQSPIGRTPRSNPATYVKLFDEIRDLFAQLPESKKRGYPPGRFSFNTEEGRCSACEGNGAVRLEMELIADLWVPCAVCQGNRYDRETLQVFFKEKNIADCLDLDVQQALEHFADIPKIASKLQTLHDVGLDYLKLGQPSPTLSGGEAQRIKLSKELSRRGTGQTLYVLDEPTTGLHFADVSLLLKVLQSLVDRGNTVVVIEHNLDIVQAADWIIDLGPEGGQQGGKVIAQGTPEQIAKQKKSYTGVALAHYFQQHQRTKAERLKSMKGTKRKTVPESKELVIQGASQHNLKDINLSLPRNEMTVFCGPSGSGKTSMAMDTIYAEGQRRYVESLSSYARQFVGQMPKPPVDRIDGLSPSVALEQKNLGHTPRSTVGTVTEIYDYLRVFMARLGTMHCPDCQIPIGTQTQSQVTDRILELPKGQKLLLLAPISLERVKNVNERIEELKKGGFVRFRINSQTFAADEVPTLAHGSQNVLQVVVDRLQTDSLQRSRLADSVETALSLGGGVLQIATVEDARPETQWPITTHSLHLVCRSCQQSFEPLTPHSFSFNSSLGWCESCSGLGKQTGANPAMLMDESKSLAQGGLKLWPQFEATKLGDKMLHAFCNSSGIDINKPIGRLKMIDQQKLLFGTGQTWYSAEWTPPNKRTGMPIRFQFHGVYPALEHAMRVNPDIRRDLAKYLSEVDCMSCLGARVNRVAAACRWGEWTIIDLVRMSLGDLFTEISSWKLDARQKKIAGELLREVTHRLEFLVDVGLQYLSLGRAANSLSGGEAQRIRLASQLGSGLCGILYVLDEPTIGLHPRDNDRLISALHRLRDLGNTLLVVEHDRDVIAGSDYLCDFGPGSGPLGGQVIAQGSVPAIKKSQASNTGAYLSGRKEIQIPVSRRPITGPVDVASGFWLELKGARENNLKNVDLAIPLGTLIAVTGPSGSGKSTLINNVLFPAIHNIRNPISVQKAGLHDSIDGLKNIKNVVMVDQSPLGQSPSSNPATYTGLFEPIRHVFAMMPEAKVRGMTPSHFSFNVASGRCEKCEGNGFLKIEMHFLPDVWVRCEACHGKRYQEEVLAVRFKGKSIADVLEMSIGEAYELFSEVPKCERILKVLCDVGLEYLALGQSAPTLSGGEAQRVKLASELTRSTTTNLLYLLDEPTTGLHFDDIAKLMVVIQRLVDRGNTVLVIEHNLDVIKCADWVIDMGPEAGIDGGQIVAQGTPEQLVAYSKRFSKEKNLLRSHTGEALEKVLPKASSAAAAKKKKAPR